MLDQLKTDIMNAIENAGDLAALDHVRVDAVGKKGRLTELLKTLGALSPDERKTQGAAINILKDEVSNALDDKKQILEREALATKLSTETLDVTLPAPAEIVGRVHPISQTIEEIIEIFAAQGFALAEGPDIEDDKINFTDLNIPENHPARQMQDTFYLPPGTDGTKWLLRTHTSPVQVRTMRSQKPPIRVIIPGRVFRAEHDATHFPMFHQVEGLVIDKGIHMGHLRGCVTEFLSKFFGTEVKTRFRPSFFPFTEPSAEFDVGCDRSKGQLKIGEGSDWLEIGGCGMVHPNVIRAAGLDPAEWQGFAFGFGIDRFAMLKYGIPDGRMLFEGDPRWLSHYGFAAHEIPSLARGTI